jgi:hypothetical protein
MTPQDKAPLLPFSHGLASSVIAMQAPVASSTWEREACVHAQQGGGDEQTVTAGPSLGEGSREGASEGGREGASGARREEHAERRAARWERLVSHVTIALLRKENRDRATENVGLHLCLRSSELYQSQSSRESSPAKLRDDSPARSRSPGKAAAEGPAVEGSVGEGPRVARITPAAVANHRPAAAVRRSTGGPLVLTPLSKPPTPPRQGQGQGQAQAQGQAQGPAQGQGQENAVLQTPQATGERGAASIVVETTPQLQVFLEGHGSPLQVADADADSDDDADASLSTSTRQLQSTISEVLDSMLNAVLERLEEARARGKRDEPARRTEAVQVDVNGAEETEHEQPMEGPFFTPEPPKRVSVGTQSPPPPASSINPLHPVQTVATEDGYLWDVAVGSTPVWQQRYGDARSLDAFAGELTQARPSASQAEAQGIQGLFKDLGRSMRSPSSVGHSQGQGQGQGQGQPKALWTLKHESMDGGIGLLLEDSGGKVTVKRLVEGGSADADGRLKVGDELVLVDGKAVAGLGLKQIFDMIKGQPGSQVRTHARGAGLRPCLLPPSPPASLLPPCHRSLPRSLAPHSSLLPSFPPPPFRHPSRRLSHGDPGPDAGEHRPRLALTRHAWAGDSDGATSARAETEGRHSIPPWHGPVRPVRDFRRAPPHHPDLQRAHHHDGPSRHAFPGVVVSSGGSESAL